MEALADITVTAENPEWLTTLTNQLVQQRLIACGNILGNVRSVYAWAGTIEENTEALAILHTRAALVPEVIEAIEQLHAYDTPQVIALPVLAASTGYHQWVLDSTGPSTDLPI